MGRIFTTLPKNTSPTSMSWQMLSMIFLAFSAAAISGEAMNTRPSSSMSILTPVSAMMPLMVLPPLPITSRILSGWMLNWRIRGA